jgi:RHS repeat-associated protein
VPVPFSYDAAARLTSRTDRNGHSYRYTYDAQHRCVRGEGPGGALSGAFSYEPGITRWTDIAGAVTTYKLTEGALVAAVTDPLGNVTTWEHDSDGRIISRVDPLARATRFSYDEPGNLIAITRPDRSEATAEYDGHCQLVHLTVPGGSVWRQEYDSRGNRSRLIAPDGTVTRFAYDGSGHLASVTGPDDAAITVACNAAGLPVEVISSTGARARYDRDASGRVTRVTDPDGAITSLDWTTEGRLASRTFPDDAVETWSWNPAGNLARHVSAAGAVTSYEYGPFDQVATVTGPDGTRTEFRYDHQLRLTEVVHGGLTWRYEYDVAGRLVSETDYNGARVTYGYDAAGQITRRVNGMGQEVLFRYDVLRNLVEQTADDAVTQFGYDPAGRLKYARNADAEVRLRRDAVGRVTAETCNGRTVWTDYDVAGRITGRTTPSGVATNWEYDPAGRPVSMIADGHQLRFSYNPSGQEVRRELPGALILTQDWDLRGRMLVQALTGPARSGRPETEIQEGAAAAEMLQRRSYSYRTDGFPDSVVDLLAGHRVMSLDPAGRVTAVTGSDWGERYAYDAVGNVTSAAWPSLPGPAVAWPDTEVQGQRQFSGTLINRAGNLRYRHDRAGRLVSRQRIRISRKPETWHYQWDAGDRLAAVTSPDGTTWRYRYDPLGRRIAKQWITSGEGVRHETTFSWDGAVLAEQAEAVESHQKITTWNYQPGTFIPFSQAERTFHGDAFQEEVDQKFYAIVTDLTGSPAELAAPDGTLAGRGQRTLWGGTLWNPDEAQTPLRLPGQYADPETGLHYNCHRYYDPVSARYISSDPLGLMSALNPHAYVANPHVLCDPLGLQVEELCQGSAQALPGNPVISAAQARADQMTSLSSRQRPAVVEALELPNGAIRTAPSIRGPTPSLHPDVQAILDAVPEEERAVGHGQCGLPVLISSALADGFNPAGSRAAAVLVRNSIDNPVHGTPIGPCESCQALQQAFDLIFQGI